MRPSRAAASRFPWKVSLPTKSDDDVDALAVRRRQHFLGEVALRRVQAPLAPRGLREIALVVAPRRRIHGAAAAADGQLNSSNRHAARARVPQHALPLLEAADEIQRLRRGDPRLGIPAHCSQLSSSGLWISMCVLTATYSA